MVILVLYRAIIPVRSGSCDLIADASMDASSVVTLGRLLKGNETGDDAPSVTTERVVKPAGKGWQTLLKPVIDPRFI